MVRSFLIGLLILLPLFLYLLFRKITGSRITVTNVPPNFQMLMDQHLSKTRYKNLLNYWLAVAKMETAGFTSKLYLNNNNPWGMKIPTKRTTTATERVWGTAERNNSFYSPLHGILAMATSQRSDFASYPTLSDGVKDIVLYMDALGYPESTPDLLSFIQLMKLKGYFGSEDVASYYAKVKAWQKR